MSILDTIKVKLGFSNTASENHFIDGSVANKLSIKRGTPASPGAEVLKIDAGVVSFPQNPVQTWQDVVASRAFNTDYTNNTAQPIKLTIYWGHSSPIQTSVLVGGVSIDESSNSVASGFGTARCTIPAGATYRVNSVGTKYTWKELR